jgi:hypothetical protein
LFFLFLITVALFFTLFTLNWVAMGGSWGGKGRGGADDVEDVGDGAELALADLQRIVASQAAEISRLEESLSFERQRVKDADRRAASCAPPAPGGGAAAAEVDARPLDPSVVPYFCTDDVSNSTRWREVKKDMPWHRNGGDFRGELNWTHAPAELHDAARAPTHFCDKVHRETTPFSYVRDPFELATVPDMVVGIYTGDNIELSRAVAVRDTWLSRLPNNTVFFYAGSDHPHIPTLGLSDQFGEGKVDEVNMVQLLGLRHMYEANPGARWYFIVGDDTYLNLDYALAMLQDYDHTVPQWITRGAWFDGAGIPAGFETSKWPRYTEEMGAGRTASNGGPGSFRWGSGASGWFVSQPLARMYAESLQRVLDDPAFERNCHCPDRLTGMVFSLLGVPPTVLPPDLANAMSAGAVDGSSTLDRVTNLMLYHYVFPMKMYAIDERAVHEKVDRLVAARDAAGLHDFFRTFISAHYRVLRHRHAELRYLAETAASSSVAARHFASQRWYEVPKLLDTSATNPAAP